MAQVAAGSPGALPVPGLGVIFLAFAKIGLTSFGGGLSGWMIREFVQRRAWLTEEEFLSGLALSQAFPGINVVNLSIWIGFRMRGGAGALAAATGMVVPAMLVAIGVATGFGWLAEYPMARAVLPGIAAAAIGLSLQMGLRAARRAAASIVPAAIMLATFLAIAVFRLPLPAVVLVMAPLGIAHAAWRRRGQS